MICSPEEGGISRGGEDTWGCLQALQMMGSKVVEETVPEL